MYIYYTCLLQSLVDSLGNITDKIVSKIVFHSSKTKF